MRRRWQSSTSCSGDPGDPITRSLSHHIAAWRNINTNHTVLTWIEEGVTIRLWSNPPPHYKHQHYFTPQEKAFTDTKVSSLFNKGAVKLHCLPKITSHLRVALKKNRKLQLMLDQHFANQYMIMLKFQYKDLWVVTAMARLGNYMVTINFTNRFEWNNMTYIYNVLPFGLLVSPYLFMKIMQPAIEAL